MTITEIARLAGVSVSTVSKIVNHKDESISAETRERVLQIVKEHNYRPYASVTSSAGRTGLIGVILAEHSGALLNGVVSRCGQTGYTAAVRPWSENQSELQKEITNLLDLHVDGMIVDGGPIATDLLPRLGKTDTPLLFLEDENSAIPKIDYMALGFAATEELIQHGHTAIACLVGRGSRVAGFIQGYRHCLFEHGIAFDEDLVYRAESELPTSRIASHAFEGIVCSHFHDALRLYRSVINLRYVVPYDLSIVSLKGDEKEVAYPEISSIKIPRRELGASLVDHLVASIERSNTPTPFATVPRIDTHASIDIPYTTRGTRIVVVGSINVDNYLYVDSLPHSGTTATSPASETYVGGKCLNEAIGVTRLGHSAATIGRVGNDADADFLYETLKASGVDTHGIQRTRDSKTGQGYVLVPRDGESLITVMSGANGALSADDIEDCEGLFAHASFCLVNTEIPLDAAHRALEIARQHGATTVLKPSAITHLDSKTLSLVDLIVPNAGELDALCPAGSNRLQKATHLINGGVGSVIVTLGADGCDIFQPDCEPHHIDAIDAPSIDSTGAGDAFISALVSYLVRGFSLIKAAHIATYAAGLSTTRQGAAASLLDRSTLESFIHQKEPNLLIADIER